MLILLQLKANGMRRVTVSEFKGSRMVNIREYWTNDEGKVLPGKKVCISLQSQHVLLQARG